MKVTKERLKQVIKEEVDSLLTELGDMSLAQMVTDTPDVLNHALIQISQTQPALAAEIVKAIKSVTTPLPGVGRGSGQPKPPPLPQKEMEEGLKDVWAGLKTGAGKVGSDISKYGKALGTSVKTGYVSSKISTALEKTSRLAGELVAELEKLKTSSEELPVAKEFIKLIPTLKDVKKEADNARNPTPASAPSHTRPPPPRPSSNDPVADPDKNLIKIRRLPRDFR